MTMRASVLGACLLLFGTLPACGGDEEPDPMAQIIGSWRGLPDIGGTLPPEMQPIRIFNADGTYLEDLDGAVGPDPAMEAGTYEISSGRLRYPPYDRGYDVICDFEITDDRLLLWVLRPVGPPDGVVGMWRGTATARYDDGALAPVDFRLTLDADGTGLYVAPLDDFIAEHDGDWTLEGDTLRFRSNFDGRVYFFGVLPDAIGQLPLERIAP